MAAKQEYRNWRLETDEAGIGWLHADKHRSGTNVLSSDVLEEFDRVLSRIDADGFRALVILSDKPNGFFAGADVREFAGFADSGEAAELIRRVHGIFDRLETLRCPTVAMIHGFCLGGGLELALACRYRVALDDPATRIGLPEVMLGIHPGYGGSVRLIERAGVLAAMDLMLSGRTLDARRAMKAGIVDRAVPERHFRNAALDLIGSAPPAARAGRLARLLNLPVVRAGVASVLRRKVSARVRREHYPAPYALIDLWERSGGDRRRMLREEAASVSRLIATPSARNLVRAFFLQERMKGIGRGSAFVAAHVHVIGAGVMGGDIAAWCALRGCRVTLQDRAPEFIGPAIGRAAKLFERRLRDRRRVQEAMDRLVPDLDGSGVGRADVVIEAIVEDADIKQALFRSVEPRLKAGAILSTNTSSIPLEVLGRALKDPARLVGLHFFNPVAKMQLVEVVSGKKTDPAVALDTAAFVKQIGRLPLPVASSPGFLVNRILMPYLLEAVTLFEEGVPGPVIDRAATDFGMPMGPITLADTVGLDICLSVARILAQSLDVAVPGVLDTMVSEGRLGKKSGQGFYRYARGKPVNAGDVNGGWVYEDIGERLIMRLLNESVACLREGVVEDADLLDAGMIFGTGFAPFRGGPMHYVSDRGRDQVVGRLQACAERYGERFTPDRGWESIAQG